MKRSMAGAPKQIHRVKVDYTVEDIMYIEPASTSTSPLWIRGVGNCHALRIFPGPTLKLFFSQIKVKIIFVCIYN